ncbi:MAG: creatininase family protein [Candidatus Binatia bacterium]
MKWGEMRWPEMKEMDRSKVVVVIPTGSMEQHGPHLPLQVDTYIVSRLAEDLERQMPEVVLLPPLWTGVSAHHMDFPGTVTLRPRVFIDLVRDVCTSLHHHGFRRIVLLNGHGGNRSSLEVLGQELYSELGLSVSIVVYWDLVPDLVKSMKKSSSKGMGHSGELETSLMLYLAPRLVSRKDIPGVPGAEEGGRKNLLHGVGVKRYVNIKEYSEIGVDGNPAAASPEDGERFYRSVLIELHQVVRGLQALPH